MGKGEAPRWPVLVIPAAVILVVALAVLFAAGGNGGGPPGSGGEAEVEREADRLRERFAARDARQVQELTRTARAARDDLAPALEGMADTMPPGEAPAGLASAEEVRSWERATRAAAGRFGDPPSGETATNVARGSLDAAVDVLGSAVLTYEQARGLPEERRSEVLERAAEGRDQAVRVWSVGATQLDAVNIEAGYGHQHVFLPSAGVGGAFTADPEPEGSGARERDGG